MLSAHDPAAVCLACGYDLRGLPRAHRCPGCGRATEPSWLAHEQAVPQTWRRRLARGLVLYAAACCLYGLVYSLLILPTPLYRLPPDWVFLAIAGPEVLSCVLMLLAAWFMTRPEPRPDGTRYHSVVALLLFPVALASALCWLALAPVDLPELFLTTPPRSLFGVDLERLAATADVAASGLGLLWDLLVMALVAHLAGRARRGKLRAHAWLLAGLVPLATLTAWLAGLDSLSIHLRPGVRMPARQFMATVAPALGLGALVAWEIVTLLRGARLLVAPQPLLPPEGLQRPATAGPDPSATRSQVETGGDAP